MRIHPRLLFFVATLLTGISCNKKVEEQTSGTAGQSTDTAAVADPVNIQPTITTDEELPPGMNDQPIEKEQRKLEITPENLMTGFWIYSGGAIQYRFSEDNVFRTRSLAPDFSAAEQQGNLSGTWKLKSDTLVVAVNQDTISYKIDELTTVGMTLKVVDKRATRLFNEDYRSESLYVLRDQEKSTYTIDDLIGDEGWAMGDGLKFHADGTFLYYDPLCSMDVPGTFEYNNGTINLTYAKNDCKGGDQFETTYEIIKLTSHWIYLRDSQGQTVGRFRN